MELLRNIKVYSYTNAKGTYLVGEKTRTLCTIKEVDTILSGLGFTVIQEDSLTTQKKYIDNRENFLISLG